MKIFRSNRSLARTSFLNYPLLVLDIFLAKLAFSKGLILNLPLEVQYPYLFYKFWEGEEFIKFAERLKKFFMIDLYWENSYSRLLEKFGLKSFSISWVSVPKDISLSLNLANLKKTLKTSQKAKKELENLLQARKKQIRLVFDTKVEWVD